MTALGPQPANLPASKRLPTTFLLCLAPQAKVGIKQLGRMVDRINASETMRLAALLDLALLRAAGDDLSLVDAAVQAARKAIDDFERTPSDLVAMRGAVTKAQCVVDAIARNFLDCNPAHAGLTFRIESARYYVSQFRGGVGSLRLGRVEGFQRYDLFVERRLGSTFEYIDRLGIRYERALQAMRSINQRYLSTTIAAMNEQSTTSGLSVERIQRDGAAIVIGLLLPYYLMGAFHYMIGFGYEYRFIFAPIVLFLWLAAIAQADFMHKRLDKPSGTSILLAAFSIGVILLFFICLIAPEAAPR